MAKTKQSGPTPAEQLAEAIAAEHRKFVWEQANTTVYRISDRSDPARPLHVFVDTSDGNFRVQYREGIDAELCPAGLHSEPEDAMLHAERIFTEILGAR